MYALLMERLELGSGGDGMAEFSLYTNLVGSSSVRVRGFLFFFSALFAFRVVIF